ncbi:hypothetical protein LQZ18_00470 [Lachnospiraceae bacterium ZAX-1]
MRRLRRTIVFHSSHRRHAVRIAPVYGNDTTWDYKPIPAMIPRLPSPRASLAVVESKSRQWYNCADWRCTDWIFAEPDLRPASIIGA